MENQCQINFPYFPQMEQHAWLTRFTLSLFFSLYLSLKWALYVEIVP